MWYFDIVAFLLPITAMFIPARYGKIVVLAPVAYFAAKYAKDSYLQLPELQPEEKQKFQAEYSDLLSPAEKK